MFDKAQFPRTLFDLINFIKSSDWQVLQSHVLLEASHWLKSPADLSRSSLTARPTQGQQLLIPQLSVPSFVTAVQTPELFMCE